MADGTRLRINGSDHDLGVDPDRTLLDVLRSELGLNAAKYGCGLGQCGACTVLVDGNPARACVLRLRHAAGHEVTTLEGLACAETGRLHPVQVAFVEREGAQCGYCLSGMMMQAAALLRRQPHPTASDIRAALRHNLCRCGTHTEIVASVVRAAELAAADG